MYIYILSEHAWESILGYLAEHHQARLFTTGDKHVQKWVVLARRAFKPVSRSDKVYSELVCDLLVPHAESVSVSARFLERSTVINSPGLVTIRVKSLTITSTVSDYAGVVAHSRRTLYAPRDLTTFSQLEKLVFDSRSYVDLLLPLSLTSLAMHDCCFGLVRNMSELVHLTHLKCAFTDDQLKSIGKDDWPRSLLSLDVWIMTFADDPLQSEPTLHTLPPTLTRLCLEDVSGSAHRRVLDVIPPLVCTRLESFEISGAPCALKRAGSRFPPSLKRLVVGELHFWNTERDSLTAALAQSSITHLDIGRTRPGEDTVESCAAVRDMLSMLLPRLNLSSLLSTIGLIVNTSYCEDAIPDVCVRSLARFGYCADFLDFVARAHAADFGSVVDAANKCDPKHVMHYLRQPNGIVHQFCNTYASFIRADTERAAFVTWLVNNGVSPVVPVSCLCHLDQSIAAKLESITIGRQQVDLTSALSRWPLDSLREIDVPSTTAYSPSLIIAAIHANRDKYPLLSLVRFRQSGYTVSEESVQLFAEMRLYPDSMFPSDYTYRVVAPNASRIKN